MYNLKSSERSKARDSVVDALLISPCSLLFVCVTRMKLEQRSWMLTPVIGFAVMSPIVGLIGHGQP